MKFLPLLSLLVLVSCTESETSSTTRTTRTTSTSPEVVPARILPKLINPTDSEIRQDLKNPGRVIVRPSKKGQIRISEPGFRTANIGFCEELKIAESWYKEIIVWEKTLSERKIGLSEIENKKEALSKKWEEAKAQNRTQEMNELKAKITLLERDLFNAQGGVRNAERRVEIYRETVSQTERIANMDYLQASISWDNKLEKNLNILEAANPDYDFEIDESPLNIKVKMKAKSLEHFEAHKMSRSIDSMFALEETDQGLTVDDIPHNFSGPSWITGFAACALHKGDTKEIIIDVEFEF